MDWRLMAETPESVIHVKYSHLDAKEPTERQTSIRSDLERDIEAGFNCSLLDECITF
jgi:hypothetical protein